MTEDDSGRRRSPELPWSVFLAWRYLRSSRQDAFISFLSAVAMGGIALGVAALILALSALNGLQQGLRAEVLRSTPEIEVDLPRETDAEPVRRAIAQVEGVETVTSRLDGNGWLLVAGSARPVGVIGFEGQLPELFPAARDRSPGFYVSDRLARLYGLEPGQLVEVASTRSTLTPLGPMPRVRRLRVHETFEHPTLETRERVAMPLTLAASLIGTASQHLVVETGSLERALRVAEAIERVLPPDSRLRTWEDLNAPLLFALRLEKRLMFVAVFLIVLVGSLALISDLSLIIASRTSEIGILGTMGASAATLRTVFLTVGALLAVSGALIGGILGALLAALFDRWALIRLPGDAYLLDHVPFLVQASDIGWITFVTLATALVCCWVGAGKAAGLRPVEALRT